MRRYVFFDLGNVLVHFDPNVACRNVAQAAGASEESVYAALYGSGIEVRYERGELDDEAFADAFRRELGRPVETSALLEGMSAMFEPHQAMLPLIRSLHQIHQCGTELGLGILSNTCRAHWNWVQHQGWEVATGWFQDSVLSYEVGHMKPEPEIYQAAAETADVPPEHIFFTDDRLENVHAAQQAGWRAEVFHSPEQLARDLRDWGLTSLALADS